MKKVNDYLSFIKKQVGNYYWMGTFGQKASWALYNDRKKAYPRYYTASDFASFASQIANPKPCFDCAGLVKSPFVYPKYNAKDDLGASGIYGKCKVKGALKSSNQLKPGYLVFKGNDKTKTHVGVYIGNNKVIEAKGHDYGVVESKFSSAWKYYAEYYNVDYSEEVKPTPVPVPDPELKMGDILTVNTKIDPLRLRMGPSLSAPIVCLMKKGSKVVYLGEESGDWLKVRYKTMIGYAFRSYLKK